jgi:indole-3-glycerol phosphate synthase
MSINSYKGSEGVLRAGGVLDRIVDARKARLDQAMREIPQGRLESLLAPEDSMPRGREFFRAITDGNRINIIAEIKRRSPSKGILREEFDPAVIATGYEAAGAAALSVLTEADFFDGALDHLIAARQSTALPVLRKDFLFDPYQLYEASAAGASAILLIAAILDDFRLKELLSLARGLGLAALVEVHTESEMERALLAEAEIIGVNNRDLSSLEVDIETSLRLARQAPDGVALVSESGIKTADDMKKLRDAGYHAFLIGEHFMVAPDPGRALGELVKAHSML